MTDHRTYTADEAKALLNGQSDLERTWAPDWNHSERYAAIVDQDGWPIMEIAFKGDDTAFSDGDIDLAAAAPDLAETVANLKALYRLEVRHAPDSDKWWFSLKSGDLEELRHFMAVNEQMLSIPDEDKRILVSYYSDWQEVTNE